MWWNIYILHNIWLIPNYSVNKKYFVVVYSSGSWYPVMTYMYCMTMPAWSIFSIRSQAPQWQWDRACNSLLWFHFNKSLGCKVKMDRTLFWCSCEFSIFLPDTFFSSNSRICFRWWGIYFWWIGLWLRLLWCNHCIWALWRKFKKSDYRSILKHILGMYMYWWKSCCIIFSDS